MAEGIDPDGPLWNSQHSFCERAEMVIGLTASPFQTSNANLLSVFKMMGGHTEIDVERQEQTLFVDDWEQRFAEWNQLLLEGVGLVGSQDEPVINTWIRQMHAQLPELLSWLEPGDLEVVMTNFLESGGEIVGDVERGYSLLRDLHPFGRCFSITRREDLGAIGRELFRGRTDWWYGVELSETHVEVANNVGQNRHIVSSWLNNINNPRYQFDDDLARPCNLPNDGRLDILCQLIREEIELFNDDDNMRGVAIFVHPRGTVTGLSDYLEEEFNNNQIELVRLTGGDADIKKANLSKARNISFRGERLPILISTSAAEVGVDMEWATVGVIWDVNSNPETIRQRSWRLDRRSDDPNTNHDFRIVHFCHQLNQTSIENMNANFSAASAILGRDRIDDFYPMVAFGEEPQSRERIWPDEGGVFALQDNEIRALRNRWSGQDEPLEQPLEWHQKLEKLFWKWISELIDLPLDLDMLDEQHFISPSEDEYEENVLGSELSKNFLSTIWRLSNHCSVDEMQDLWILASCKQSINGGAEERVRLALRQCPPDAEHGFGVITIRRNGQVSRNLLRLLLSSSENQNLLRYGVESPYLGWIFDSAHGNDGIVLLVEKNWLIFYMKHFELLGRLGIKSPLLVSTADGEMCPLESFEPYQELLSEAISYARFDENYGSFYGEVYSIGESRPVLEPLVHERCLEHCRNSVIELRNQIREYIMTIPAHERRRENWRNLWRELDEFTEIAENNAECIIPILYVGGK